MSDGSAASSSPLCLLYPSSALQPADRDDPFLLELRTRFSAHIIDGLFPRAAREGTVNGADCSTPN